MKNFVKEGLNIKVRIIKDWDKPDIMRQTPEGKGIWAGIEFTTDDIKECNFVIVLNRIPYNTTVMCSRKNIWAIMQEPPVKEYAWLEKGYDSFFRVITPKEALNEHKYIHDSLALPWHINKTYDELINLPIPEKLKTVSWVTSATKGRAGHKRRIEFLKQLQEKLDFDLWGRGFTPIDDKWDGIAPYKYTLAIENNSGPDYWTEKISDCFLAWTMPIYYGCSNIEHYFPKEAMIQIDIENPKEAIEIIENAIHENLWEKNIKFIEIARDLVLNKYQLFPYVENIIEKHYDGNISNIETVYLQSLPYSYPIGKLSKLKNIFQRIINFLKR